jgi:hypothetical protein
VPVHHEIDADPREVRFFARFGKEDNVAVQRHIVTLQQQHRHKIRHKNRFVIPAAATPDVAIFHYRAEWIHGPFFALYANHIRVGKDQQRALASVAPKTRDHIGAVRVQGEGSGRDALGFQHLPQILNHTGLVAGRTVNLYERAVTLKNLDFVLLPVDRWNLGISRSRK